jgi:hypothetical protein
MSGTGSGSDHDISAVLRRGVVSAHPVAARGDDGDRRGRAEVSIILS